ncbi:MAG TPA: bifunctional phosphoglucose/phosphomannose isomerase [Candidatus Deferrimicrobium sp.]|nr:bifunctional phosphoglucose/phosphomannose isomerase [Candidatus Deferrimicrobium sp.]
METTTLLDDVEKIREADPSNMYNRIFDFPEQLSEALKIGQKWEVRGSDFSGVKNIVLVGMGGSAIAGDLARSYMRSQITIPFDICRHYVLPEYVDDETLIIASSYSGNTEETLAALDDALSRKAMVAAMSTGGLLQDVADVNAIPLAQLPSGYQPRAALAFSLVPLLTFFEKIGLLKNVVKEIKDIIPKLQSYREKYIEDSPVLHNPAKSLAQKIQGRIPIIYSGPTLTDGVALRWKGQFCENGKNLAFANQFAEFNHNELVGWSDPVKAHQEHLIVIILRDADDHPQIRKRMNIVKDLIQGEAIDVIEVHSRGELALERMLSLVQLGDFISYYLAVLNEVDPTPVEVIEKLKQSLRQSG